MFQGRSITPADGGGSGGGGGGADSSEPVVPPRESARVNVRGFSKRFQIKRPNGQKGNLT